MSDVIKYHEKDFFAAFKERMLQIKLEMQDLKDKASAERLKLKHDERLVELEKERDWFWKEALQLDKMCRDAKRQVKKMRTNVENAQEDWQFYQTQLLKCKKINKALIIELEKFKDEPLMITSGLEQKDKVLSIKNEGEQSDDESLDKIFET